jgi:hypothetical protein
MDTILAVGAQGECPAQLIALLQAGGYPGGGDGETLTPEIMAAVTAAQAALDVAEPDELWLSTSTGVKVCIKGTLVGQATWDALRAQAAHRTGLVTPAQSADAIAKVAIETHEATEAAATGVAAAALRAAQAAPDEEPEQPGAVEETPEGVSPGEKAAQAAAAAAAAGGSPAEVAAAAAGAGASPEAPTAAEAAAAAGEPTP